MADLKGKKKKIRRKRRKKASMVLQWVRLHASNAGDPGLILGQRIKSHMPQLRACMSQLMIPCAARD